MDLEIGDELWSVGAKFVGLTPLNKEAWAELVKFIKDSPRPLEVGWRRKQYSRPQSAEQPTDASAQETAVPQETEVRQASTTSEDVAAAYAKSLQEAANRVDDSDGDSDYGDGHIRRSEEAYSHTKEAAGEVSSGKSTERNSQDQATEVASSQENAFTLSTPATPQQETAPDIKAIATEECASEGGEEEKGEEDDHKEMIEVFVQKLVFAESAKSPSPGFMQRKLSANSPSNSSKSSKRPPQVDMILNGRRRFIREGPIQTETKGALWASNHKKYVFLLTGLLILTTPKDNKYLVDMIFELPTCKVDSHLHVDPNGVSSSVEYALKSFEFHSPSGVYKFVCSEPTEKEGWVSLIIDAIYQCVVNAEEPVLGWRHQYALGTLHAAVISRDVVKVREYLHRHVANGEKNVDEVDEDGYTALHYACILRLHSIIRALYDFDPDITVSDRRGYTALHWAAMQLDYETIELISQRLYSADMYDLEGRTPLLLACVEGRTISGHSDPIALAKCVSRLVTLQADPNVRDQSGVSVIHYLAASWQYEALKLLLDAKADIYVTSDADSLNALHYAVLARSLRHSEGLASSLLSSANSSMRIGTSSKENSKKEGDDMLESDTLDFERAAPTIATFLKAGGRPNSREGNGKSALHILAEREGVWKGNIGRIVITLLEGGARLDDTPGCALIKSRFTEMGCAAELDAAMEKWNSKPVLNADSAEFE
jgi:ankyrin repeat protein